MFGDEGESEPLRASVAIVCFPEDGTSSKDLLDSAMSDLAHAKKEREELANAQASRSVNPLARGKDERMRA